MPLRKFSPGSACALILLLLLVFPVTTYGQDEPAPEGDPATSEAPPEPTTEPASEPAAPDDEIAQLKSDLAAAALAGHNGWMLTCCALVLFMTAPGLAMFYSGLVRKKNVLGVMMQCVFLMGLMTVLWALYGYSLAFGGDNPYIGNGEYLFMNNVQQIWNEPFEDANNNGTWDEGEEYTDSDANGSYSTGAVTPMSGAIPTLTHMLFQGMFFIITPALICGAFAERMKVSTMVVFSVLWGTIVYCPLCHWVWDGGILAFVETGSLADGNGIMGGALDFAGGTVVHISSGVSALVCAWVIGRRLGMDTQPMPPHNLTYTTIGTTMLWFGWFGFNAGSELASDGLTSSAFAVTHFSAAAGAVSWAVIEWLTRGKPSMLGACSGAVAGLVCITPAAGFVNPMPALVMGALAGAVCYYAVAVLKEKLGYDDSLDAFGVHGVGGTLGAILTGVFATRACWDIDGGNKLGLIEGETRVFIGQIVATIITWVFAAVVSFVLLKILDLTMGLRVTQEEEIQGLDLSQHGEEGYIFL